MPLNLLNAFFLKNQNLVNAEEMSQTTKRRFHLSFEEAFPSNAALSTVPEKSAAL